MKILPCLGIYFALLKNPQGGGFIGRGSTRATAIANCLRVAGLT